MILLASLQLVSRENNVAFWLMVVVFIIIVVLVAKHYIKHEPSSNNSTEEACVESQQFKEDTPINKPSNISVNKHVDKFQQLRDLKDLLDEEILTQEEFNVEKTKVLNSD